MKPVEIFMAAVVACVLWVLAILGLVAAWEAANPCGSVQGLDSYAGAGTMALHLVMVVL